MTNQEPDWIRELRVQCVAKSQNIVAKEIGYSSGTVSQVLNNIYPCPTHKIEAAVRGAYLGATVECPVLGALQKNHCLSNQRAKFMATNPLRVKLYRACHSTCPHSQVRKEKINASKL